MSALILPGCKTPAGFFNFLEFSIICADLFMLQSNCNKKFIDANAYNIGVAKSCF